MVVRAVVVRLARSWRAAVSTTARRCSASRSADRGERVQAEGERAPRSCRRCRRRSRCAGRAARRRAAWRGRPCPSAARPRRGRRRRVHRSGPRWSVRAARTSSTTGALKHTATQPSSAAASVGPPVGRADLDDGPGQVGGLPPPLARPVEVPAAGHAHVGLEGPAVVEVHEQVLAPRLDTGDDGARLRPRAGRAVGLEAHERPVGEGRRAAGRRPGGWCRPRARSSTAAAQRPPRTRPR